MSIRVLHIDSSLFGDSGVSSELGKTALSELKSVYPDADFIYRDLVHESIPHFTGETIAAIADGSAHQADQYIAEIEAADIVVIGAPMYNFMIPSQLKAWFDHLARAGTTFKYTEAGAEGLLDSSKKVLVLSSRGGIHKDQPSDLVTPYVKTILDFFGLEDVHFIYAEGLAMGNRETVIDNAKTEIADYVNQIFAVKEAV